MKTLTEKVAFVTGGTRGMGEAIVRRLASEGASVAFTYVSSEEKAKKLVDEIHESGGSAVGIRADAGESGALTKAINETVEKFGKIDILVNNAAIAVAGPLDQAAERSGEYDRQVDANIRAVSEAVRAAVKHIPEGGRIINICSVGGRRIGGPYMSDYAATKAAISGYTRGLAWDLAPRNITVNTVEPGAIDTDMMPSDPTVREAFTNAIPLKRLGKPQDIAAMGNFLSGPEASYITGSSFAVDGGINA